jgi:hypothetical protein
VTVKDCRKAIATRLALDGHEHGGTLRWSDELSRWGKQGPLSGGEHRATTLHHQCGRRLRAHNFAISKWVIFVICELESW